MSEYTWAADRLITDIFEDRGHATVYALPGYAEDDACELLAEYARVHASGGFTFDGHTLVRAGSAEAGPGESTIQSPVDSILSLPEYESRLDTLPAEGRVPRQLLWLPLLFGLFGGGVAWLMLRPTHPRAARFMLYGGAIITFVEAVVIIVAMSVVGRPL